MKKYTTVLVKMEVTFEVDVDTTDKEEAEELFWIMDDDETRHAISTSSYFDIGECHILDTNVWEKA